MSLITIKHLKKFADGFSEKAMNLFAKKEDIPKSLPAAGGNADTVNGHTVNADVPTEAKFTDTDTTYSVMSGCTASEAGTQGLVPAPEKGKEDAVLCGNGTWKDMIEATDAEIDAIIEGSLN